MAENEWASVSLPRALWDRVRILPLRELGYASPSEVVKDAVREKLDALELRGKGRSE